MKLPSPRPVPTHVGIDVPHVELRRACHYFWDELLRAEIEARRDADELRARFGVDADYRDAWPVELYAATIHVYAAMTADAMMNVFAVARYGSKPFEEHFRWGPPKDRLRRMLHHVENLDLTDAAEPVLILERLFGVRNYLMHAQSAETHYNEAGRATEVRDHPVISKDTAESAIRDLDRFAELMMSYDAEIAGFLYPM